MWEWSSWEVTEAGADVKACSSPSDLLAWASAFLTSALEKLLDSGRHRGVLEPCPQSLWPLSLLSYILGLSETLSEQRCPREAIGPICGLLGALFLEQQTQAVTFFPCASVSTVPKWVTGVTSWGL